MMSLLNSKFQLLPSPLAPPPQKLRGSPAVACANMVQLHTNGARALQVPISKTIRKTKPKVQPLRQQIKPQCGPSIVELLGVCVAKEAPPAAQSSLNRPRQAILDAASYFQKLQSDISSDRLLLHGNPWVVPDDAFQAARRINDARSAAMEDLIGPDEALHLVLRPTVFVWAPQKLLPELTLRCPHCAQCTTKFRWCRARVLHRLDGQFLYLATRHTCDKCSANPRHRDASFQSDAPEVIKSLPQSLQQFWSFMDTGRTLVDVELANFCCAMSTRSSWATIASVVHEMKATRWMRESTVRYLKLCEMLNIQPTEAPKELPSDYKLREDWVRDFCVRELRRKEPDTFRELSTEFGDDILVLDWTHDAASRCHGKFMFNAMSGAQKVLASALTNTCGPYEVEPVVRSLANRGVRAKAAYVDDECCGAWRILHKICPGIEIRLDGFHALRRLTQTTASTQHPWHGVFCARLSDALYSYDAGELQRLHRARAKAGFGKSLPKGMKAKYVPRVIADAAKIEQAFDSVIESFAGRSHEEMGPLLTPQTHAAWQNLRLHVRAGCLCDPPGMNMNIIDEQHNVSIGGEIFRPIKSLRGASGLEGFHCHQKQWLGMFAHHSTDAGLALISEGTLRWNRKRKNEASDAESKVPLVFARGLLHEANSLHQRLTGNKLYAAHTLSEGDDEAPVCCMAMTQNGKCASV
jgi:hypothetical protein